VFRICPRFCLVVLAACASTPTKLIGQAATAGGTPPEVSRAQAAFAAGQVDSAIRTLEDFFQRNPNATTGWLLLGNAYRQKGDVEKALAAFQRVTVPRPARLQASYTSAAILASLGRADTALALLVSLKATGAFDMEIADTARDFANLRSHPRFAATQFQAAEFERPFVEPVRVIHEWRAETKGDQFSWIARAIGDIDGDKVNDVVTSAPSYETSATGQAKGRVYVYAGKSGRLIWQYTGDAGDNLGTGLEGAGDVNRDGVGDVVAGAPGSNRAYVLSGVDGKPLHVLRGTAGEGFGASASGAGDQDGDGHADVVIGAPNAGQDRQSPGRAYVFSGKTGQRIVTFVGERAADAFGSIVAGAKWGRQTPINVGAPGAGPRQRGKVYVFQGLRSTPHMQIDADSTGGALGAMFTSLVGDVDGDNVPDIFASDFANTAKGPATGRVYVRSGRDGRALLTLTGEQAGDGFGIGSADAGDVNKDGYDDLVLGAWQHAAAAPSGGKIYVYSGRDGTLLRSITGRIPGETLGFDATGTGDVDGDGIVDLLVTSSWSNVKGFRSGRMYIIAGVVPTR
jgi:hypothetical protein